MGRPQTLTPTRLGEKQPHRSPRGSIRTTPAAANDGRSYAGPASASASHTAGTATARTVTGNTKKAGDHAATRPNRQGRNTQQKPRRHTQHPHQGAWVSVCGAFVSLNALATRAMKTRQKRIQRILWQR